jgi:hypothetical protein
MFQRLLTCLLALLFCAQPIVHAAPTATATPHTLGQLLNTEGKLDLQSGFNGNLDAHG